MNKRLASTRSASEENFDCLRSEVIVLRKMRFDKVHARSIGHVIVRPRLKTDQMQASAGETRLNFKSEKQVCRSMSRASSARAKKKFYTSGLKIVQNHRLLKLFLRMMA